MNERQILKILNSEYATEAEKREETDKGGTVDRGSFSSGKFSYAQMRQHEDVLVCQFLRPSVSWLAGGHLALD